MNGKARLTTILLAMGLAAIAATAAADDIHVPGDSPTIEQGCVALADGDTLTIAPGTYDVPWIDLWNKSVFIRGGTGNPVHVVLIPTGDMMFQIHGSPLPDATFEALTFQGAETQPTALTNKGIDFSGNRLVLRKCRFQYFYGQHGVESHGIFFAAEDCVWSYNYSEYLGGGFSTYGKGNWLRNCYFFENGSAQYGGAVWCTCRAVFEDCTFARNTAAVYGGAVAMRCDVPVRFDRCTFVENVTGAGGGTIHMPLTDASISPQFVQCVIAFNEGAAFDIDPSPEFTEHEWELVFFATDIYGNTGGDWLPPWSSQLLFNGENLMCNLAVDPVFCDRAGGDFRLDPDSPCLKEVNGWVDMGSLGEGCGGTVPVPPAAALGPGPDLEQNHPNPFNPSTEIEFELRHSGPVKLEIYDVRGRLVRTLLDENRQAGRHRAAWDGRDDRGRSLASGVYMYRLEAGGATRSQRMALVR